MNTVKRLFVSFGPVIVLCCIIFYISSFPTAKTSEIQLEDFFVKKLAHVLEYGLLAALTYRALRRSGVQKKRALLLPILFVFFYGATDELHQRFVPGRGSAFRDVIIDTFGASLAILSIWKLLPKAPQSLKPWVKKLELL